MKRIGAAVLYVGELAALAATLASPALAQESAASGVSAEGLKDIAVYAQKKARGEQLQKVPMAISAIDAKIIEASHAIVETAERSSRFRAIRIQPELPRRPTPKAMSAAATRW